MSVVLQKDSVGRAFDRRRIVGWAAVGLSITVTCIWAYWGIIENFHEGWYFESWTANVGLMLAQYLSPMLVFMGVTLVPIFFPRPGAALHVILALVAAWFFDARSNAAIWLLITPLIGLGAMYWYGRPQPRLTASLLAIVLPIVTLSIFGVGPAIRVSRRVNDGNLQARYIAGDGIILMWAPEGPGWPLVGTTWYEAREICQRLHEDGLTLAAEPQNYWHLPTVDEAVRSMSRHGFNSGGEWDAAEGVASYERQPDKESPLWNVHSQVIYWWTDTEVDEEQAYIVAYDGRVWPRAKQLSLGYLGYRCVR